MRSLSPEPVSFLQQAPSNSTAWQAYNAGVKMGCWGLVIYAATGAICSGERSLGAAVRPRASCPFKQGRLSHGDRIMKLVRHLREKPPEAVTGNREAREPSVAVLCELAPAGGSRGWGGSDQGRAQVPAGLQELCR